MSKVYVNWWVIDELEVSLPFEQAKLFIVILSCEIEWNDIWFVFDSILL